MPPAHFSLDSLRLLRKGKNNRGGTRGGKNNRGGIRGGKRNRIARAPIAIARRVIQLSLFQPIYRIRSGSVLKDYKCFKHIQRHQSVVLLATQPSPAATLLDPHTADAKISAKMWPLLQSPLQSWMI